MKILITGVTGFAGPHLAEKCLGDGHEVWGMHRTSGKLTDSIEGVNYIYNDLGDLEHTDQILSDNKFDSILHLGAFTHPPSSFDTPSLAFHINANGTIAIVDAILKYQPDCIFMQASTPEVYGICPGDKKIDETFPMNPMNPYGISKAAADMYVLERCRNVGFKGFLTRAFSHCGPRRKPNYSISSDAIQIAKIIKGKQDPIIKVGNLKAQRVVADVRDIVDVYYQLMIKMAEERFDSNGICVKFGEVFHIAGNDLHEIGYYLNLMLKMFNVKAELVIDNQLYRPIDIPIQIPDDSKVRKFLNWKPKIKIEDTLKDLVEYWLELL